MRIIMKQDSSMKYMADNMRNRIIMATAMSARAAYSHWQMLAQNQLMTSRAAYLAGLREPDLKLNERGKIAVAKIELVGWLPNAVERGITSFDMKKGLLTKRRTLKDGTSQRYNIIPFRHGTTKVTGSNFPPINPRRDTSPVESLKHLKRANLIPSRTKVSAFPIPVRHPKSRAQVAVKNIYKGIKKYGGGGRGMTGGIFTFRTVTDKSPANSWVHPGITGRKFSKQVAKWAINNVSEFGIRKMNLRVMGTFK